MLLVVTVASLPWLVHAAFDPKNDACMYVLAARSLLAGEGYSLLGEPLALRPPGFSLLIAPLLAVFGTDFLVLDLFVNLFGVAAVALLFELARPRVGARLALVLALFVWFNPGFRASCNQVMSDVPGVALALVCLVGEARLRAGYGASVGRAFGLGLLVGAAALVRTVDVLLLPAFLVATFLRRAPASAGGPGPGVPAARRGPAAVALTLGTLVVLAPWVLRNARTEVPAPTEQTSIHSYSTGLFHVDPGDPSSARLPLGDVVARIPSQLGQTAETLGSRFTDPGGPFSSPPGPASVAGVLALACIGFVALRRREPLELAALAMVAMVGLYFAFVDRLVLPVFVLGLPAVVETLCLALGRLGAPRARFAVGLGLAVLALVDARHLADPGPLEQREERMRALAAELDRRLPEGEPVAARLGWELGVYLERRRVYSLYIVAKRDERAGMLELLGRHGIDTCVFQQGKRDDRTLSRALQPVFRSVGEIDGWSLVQRR